MNRILINLMTMLAILAGGCSAASASTATPPPAVHLKGWHIMRDGHLRAMLSDREGMRHFHTCAYEDSVRCWWNSGTMGNKSGNSFVAVVREGWTCLAFLDPTYAATYDRCIEGDR